MFKVDTNGFRGPQIMDLRDLLLLFLDRKSKRIVKTTCHRHSSGHGSAAVDREYTLFLE